MEALSRFVVFGLFLSFSIVSPSVSAQEYDDLYFNGKDRKKVNFENGVSDDSRATYESYANNNYKADYSTHNVNPDYIARYKSGSTQNDYQNPEDNKNYKTPSASTIDYYVDENPQGTTVVNNYYSNSAWNNPNMGFGGGFGYDPFFGWNNGVNINIGFGNVWNRPFVGWNTGFGWNSGWGFNNGWGWNDPWFHGGNRWNAWNRPWGGGFGYNAGFYDGFQSGIYNGYNSNNVESPPMRSRVSGGRYVRGGVVSGASRLNNSSRVSSVVSTPVRSTTDRRDYSSTQNEYYKRSRASTGREDVSSSRSSPSNAVSSRTSANRSNGYVRNDNSANARSSSTANTRRYTAGSSRTSTVERSSSSGRNYSSGRSSSSSTRSFNVNPSSTRSSRSSSGSSYNRSSGSSRSSGATRSSSGSSRSSSGSSRRGGN